jgi:RimJ/RimL family protein N-acetyltransferase
MLFDLQPVLEGKLLRLRPLRQSDFDDLYQIASDPLLWEQHPNNDRYQKDVFKEFFRSILELGGALVAIDTKDGRIIGSSRFHGYDEASSEVEIGWSFLARSHWGGAYNGEMKRLMLQHAFKHVRRVVFLIGAENFRSRKAVEKIGGVFVGTRLNENGQNRVLYELTAEKFNGA